MVDLVRDLAWYSGRGRSWQSVGVGLIDEGWAIEDEGLLQTLAVWVIDRGSARLRALALTARRDGLITDEDLSQPDPYVAIAAGLVHRHRNTRSMRPLLRRARDSARADHPSANRQELSQLATDYMTAIVAERLGSDLMAHAVLPGIESPDGISATGTDRPTIDMRSMRACAGTLTAAETELSWGPIIHVLRDAPGPAEGERELSMLYLIVRVMTEARINWHGDVTQPLELNDIVDVLGLERPEE